MTGELMSRSYIGATAPRSSEKIMKFVIHELKEECPCPLDGEAATGVEDSRIAVPTESPVLYFFPHGSL